MAIRGIHPIRGSTLPRRGSRCGFVWSCLLGVLTLLAPSSTEAQTFTVDDVFDVASLQVMDLSADGRWAVVNRVTLDGRLGLNSHRYGDPTYVSPARGRLMVVNTATGAQTEVFGADRQVGAAAWNPSGRRLAVTVYDDGDYRLYIYDRDAGVEATALPADVVIAGGQGSRLDWLDDATVLLPVRPDGWQAEAQAEFARLTEGPITVYSGDDPFLAWEALRRRGAEAGLVSVDVDGGTVEELLEPVTLGQSRYHIASSEGALVYEVDVTEGTSYDVIFGTSGEVRVVSLDGGEPRTLMTRPEDRRLQWSGDGSTYAYAVDGDVFVRAIDADEHKDLAGGEGDEPADDEDDERPQYSVQAMSFDGESIVVSSQDGLWHVDVDSGDRTLIVERDEDDDEAPNLQAVAVTADDVLLQYRAATEWERGLDRWDRESAERTILFRDNRLYSGFRVSEDGTTLLFNSANGNRPLDLYAQAMDQAAPRRIVESNPQLDDETFGRTELVRYLDVDGDRLNGVVYYPPDYREGTPYPTIFVVYETFFDDRFNSAINVLTNAGYVVMQPSVDLEIGFPGEAWLKGVSAAANTLIERGIADPDRLGVHGTSYGGYATNLLVTQTDRFAAAINISGKVDMISFYTDSPRLGVRNIHAPENSQDRIGATLWEQPQKYIAHSAIMAADRIDTPLLLMTGEQDHNVTARTTLEMYYALRRLGKTVEWVNYVNGGHGMPRTTAAEVRDYYERILGWYDRFLNEDAEEEERVSSGS